ncbi:MAG: hypothetical protein LBQ50_13990 [Planctomycetaceae bacterium]|jgi:hypothetical protein|nr:hypothetical protein [Planctomycetaceae bacterium]
MSTPNIPDATGLTFEKIWQMYQEDAKQKRKDWRSLQKYLKALNKKDEERRKEDDERRKEYEERMKKENEERRREYEERRREYEERMKKENEERRKEDEKRRKEYEERRKEDEKRRSELEKQMKRTDAQLGKLGNRFGEMVEHLIAPGIADLFNELGYHFHGIYSGDLEFKDEKGESLTEVDILLENDEFIIAVEVKSKPRVEDIPHHINRLKILQQYFKKHRETEKKVIGAIAGAIFAENVKKAVVNEGLYVITQSGDTVKIDVPENFQPQLF